MTPLRGTGDQADTGQLPGELTDEQRANWVAQFNLVAARRRGEIPDEPPPLPSGLAGQIVRAGMVARGELVEDREPLTEAGFVAAQIVRAGRKRRGEI